MIKHDLIKEIGIEKAKAIVEGVSDSHYCTGISDYTDGYDDVEKCPDCVSVQDLHTAIAQYGSREFKVGDLVVLPNSGDDSVFKYVEYSKGLDLHFFESEHNYGHAKLSNIRHATPSEIAAGYRLDHSVDVTDMITDITNHISPSTKVINHG